MALPSSEDRPSAGFRIVANPPWTRVKEVVAAALDRLPAERAEYVVRASGSDDALRVEVQSLLTAMEQAGAFIEAPALQSLAQGTAASGIADVVQRVLNPGDSLGPYTVVEFLGAGGMGEVYRGRDAKLNRDVALKVRAEAFRPDSDRFVRFTREAHFLASLNHQNIAAIYGLEERDGVQALVLELVEGPTLADRIAEGPVPINEALAIAKQMAKGLQAAHERGIIHRDLKPSNIKVRSDGTVKILDFGLAKAFAASDSDSVVPVSSAVTKAGLVLGTAAYMSPEQARGRTVDKRTDIWAFGCVVYEALTGRQSFGGETIQDSLAAVLGGSPDWSLLPVDTPPSVVRLLRRCLEKDADRRLHDIADARIDIEDALAPKPIAFAVTRARVALWSLAIVATLAIMVAIWSSPRSAGPPSSAASVRRLLIGLPGPEPLARAALMPLGSGQPALALSPDGMRVTYVMEREGVTTLYLHALDQVEAAPISGTEGAFGPFFSPDGRWIGFFARNKLKKVAVSGGVPIDLSPAPNPYGGSWGTDGTIVFAADEGRRLTTIPDTGGEPQPVVVKGAGSLVWPEMLPGVNAAIVSDGVGRIGVLSLETGEYRALLDNGSHGRYAPTGHLVFSRAGALLAAPFDLGRRVLSGPATVILDGVQIDGQRAVAQAAFSQDGTLIYVPGGSANDGTRPVWVDRHGTVDPVGMPPRPYRSFSLSPNGRHLAVVIANSHSDLWVQDLERGALTRLTSGRNGAQPIWTPDGRRIIFSDRSGERFTPFSVPVDGGGEPERVFDADHRGSVTSFSPGNDLVAFQNRGSGAGLDLWMRPLKGTEIPQPFLRTPFTEAGARFSPNGRWISYTSDESGQSEVYVRPYPGPGGKFLVSTQGGEENVWSRDGKELFYRNGNKWMVVDVTLQTEFKAGTPRMLFDGPYVSVGGLSYDVTPDGRRFLLLEPAEQTPITHLNVVLNWFEEMKQKAGPGLGQSPH
jgi:Tol biopolymer transport system component/tRNA A-37 threonylcarbamoyl transferase component Bud32